jgi:hypothetical protein
MRWILDYHLSGGRVGLLSRAIGEVCVQFPSRHVLLLWDELGVSRTRLSSGDEAVRK